MSSGHRHGSRECREIFAKLSEYLDQELDPSLCDRIEGHLEDCQPCRVFLDSLRTTVGLLRDTPPQRLPEDLRRSLLDEYERLKGERPRS